MSADEITAICWWYLHHVQYFLLPGAVFDLICWAIIITKRKQILAWINTRGGE